MKITTVYWAVRAGYYEFRHYLWRHGSANDGWEHIEEIPDITFDDDISGQHSGNYHRKDNVVYRAYFHRFKVKTFTTTIAAERFMKNARLYLED